MSSTNDHMIGAIYIANRVDELGIDHHKIIALKSTQILLLQSRREEIRNKKHQFYTSTKKHRI
jgi:hypothetical protein